MSDARPPTPARWRGRPRRSAAWSLAWRVGYRLVRILDLLIRSWVANDLPGLGGTVELRFVGRRTGRPRSVLVTLLGVGGRWYVGHPNGEAAWVRNVEASGWVDVDPSGALGPRFRAVRLPDGPERDAVIRSTPAQQPFPANLMYRLAQRHIRAVGVYHLLEPIGGATAVSSASAESSVPVSPDPPSIEGAR